MKDLTIQPHATVKEAMEKLDKTAEKVLLVVDKDYTLIGSLTDGDIRRHILKGCNLGGTIQQAYNKNPIFEYRDNLDMEKIRPVFTKNKIDLIPILDPQNRVVDFLTWEKLFGNSNRLIDKQVDAPVVIMAGGKGTRLEPFTKILPKPLVPVGDKPVIDHIIDRFRAYGVHEFYLTINYLSKILRAYFEEKSPDYSIFFAQEDEPRGTAGSLKLLADKLDRPFFMSNCDIIIKAGYHDLYQFHLKNNYDITMVASTTQINIPYGICELNGNGSLERIQEKPQYSFLVNTGLYVLNPDVINFIPDDGLFHITDLVDAVKINNGSIGVYPVSETSWVDVGQWEDYRNALKTVKDVWADELIN